MGTYAYLTWEHFNVRSGGGGAALCDLSAKVSCSAVAASAQSEILGIPVALLGFGWFAVVLTGVFINSSKKAENTFSNWFGMDIPFALFGWSVLGLGFVLWFMYAEFFIIGSICIFCTLAHILTITILFISYKLLRKPIRKYIKEIFYR